MSCDHNRLRDLDNRSIHHEGIGHDSRPLVQILSCRLQGILRNLEDDRNLEVGSLGLPVMIVLLRP